jgi:hypothetical protein
VKTAKERVRIAVQWARTDLPRPKPSRFSGWCFTAAELNTPLLMLLLLLPLLLLDGLDWSAAGTGWLSCVELREVAELLVRSLSCSSLVGSNSLM